MGKPDDGLSDMLAPIESNVFLANYWETKPLSISRKSPGYYHRFITLTDAINFITATEMREPELRLVRDGTPLPTQTYTWKSPLEDIFVNIDRVFSEFHTGATVILDALQRKWKPLALLCRSLELFFHQGVQANTYLTPKNSQGFAAHYDTHDVFVLQIAGSKHWRIYRPPIELPLSSQPFPPSECSPKKQFGEPIYELDLEDGDCLYIPRGWVHEASAGGNVSAHVTIGINAFTWAYAFSQALDLVSKQDIRFRKCFPVCFENTGQAIESVGVQFRELAAILANNTDVEVLVDQIFDRFVLTRMPILYGHITDLEDLARINLETPLTKRQGLISRLSSEDQFVSISFHGKRVSFPKHIEPVLRFIAGENGEITPGSLPGNLDGEGRLVLMRRLVKEGYLTVKC